MVVGSMKVETEILIIGGGPGGYAAALRAASLDKDVMLVEEDKLGGVCLNYGCIPTKALIHASDFYELLGEKNIMGITVKDYSLDLKEMKNWKDGIIEKLTKGIAGLCKNKGVEVLEGKAIFTSENEVHIEGKSDVTGVRFKKAIVSTGSRPIEIPGFEFSEDVMSNKEALELEEVPSEIIVLGGGYIGIELGIAFSKLGSKINIIEMQDSILPNIERELASVVQKRLERYNIKLYLNTKATSYKKTKNKVKVEIEKDGKKDEIKGDKILSVVGRKPNTDKLDLEKANVVLDEKGFVKVNNQMYTSNSNVLAIGDMNDKGPMLAHNAMRQGKVAAEVVSGMPSEYDVKCVPSVVYNEPELASVGLTEKEAEENQIKYQITKFPLQALGRALTVNEKDGFVKIVYEEETGVVLGVHGVGSDMSNVISEATLAIELGATIEDLALTIHAHPTMSESIMEAAEKALGINIHTE